MPLDMRQAASNLIDAGATDDEIKSVLGHMKDYAGRLIDEGRSDQEVESLISKSKWKNTEVFKAPVKAPAEPKPEKPGFLSNVAEEFGAGARTAFSPGEAKFPFSEKLRKSGTVGEVAANVIGSGLGAAQAAFAVPTAAAKTYIEQPLEETSVGKKQISIPMFDPEGNFQWVPMTGAQAAGLGVGAAIPFAGGPLRAAAKTSKLAATPLRVAGAALDPLGALGATSKATKAKIAEKEAAITGAKAKVAAETAGLERAQAGVTTARQAKAGLEKQFGEMAGPQLPVAPERMAQGIIKPEAEVAKGAERAAETFGQVKTTTTENLFAESSRNYQRLEQTYGHLPVSVDDARAIADKVSDLQESLRGTTAQRQVAEKAGQIEPTIRGQSIAGLGADAQKFINEALSTGAGLKVGDLMQMRQRLTAANRATSDLGAINANKQVISTIDDALSHLPQQAGKDFNQARVFHQYVHETVGPESITTQIFGQSPENVVKNIFLPEGKTAPNIEAIRKTREMFNRTLPEGWSTITNQALGEFGNRIKDARSGTLDVQKYLREFGKFEGAFREALPKSQFQAMQDFSSMVKQFNQESAIFRAAQAGLKKQIAEAGKGITEAGRGVTAQRQVLKGAQQELSGLTGTPRSMIEQRLQQFAGPYTMLAIAQVAQAGQAAITQGIASPAVFRQLAQGVIWYTLGNPDFLRKMIASPKMSKALSVVASGEGGTPKLANAARAIHDAMQEDQGGQQ